MPVQLASIFCMLEILFARIDLEPRFKRSAPKSRASPGCAGNPQFFSLLIHHIIHHILLFESLSKVREV
jgi:hypothetical protein